MKIFCAIVLAALLLACDPEGADNSSETPPVIEDPLYQKQWWLKNTGQGGGTVGLDLNIEPVWQKGYFGQGMNVAVFDDAVDENHPDLKSSLAKVTKLVTPAGQQHQQPHGTPVVGIIADQHNGIGTRGVAPQAKIYFYDYGEPKPGRPNERQVPPTTDWVKALSQDAAKIAVYSNSWSHNSGGFYQRDTMKFHQAFDEGIKTGFQGKGSVYVFASGNALFYRLASDVLLAHPGVVAVAGVTKKGDPLTTRGVAIKQGYQHWVSAFSEDVLTTDFTDPVGSQGGYAQGNYHTFSGTSAAAPMVAGIVALIRQANKQLTYRDVKLILAETARRDPIKSATVTLTWQNTGKKYSDASSQYSYNQLVGFGLVDAAAAVNLATTWTTLPTLKTEPYPSPQNRYALPKDTEEEIEIVINNSSIRFIESIQLSMDLQATKTVNATMGITLIDPQGRNSVLSHHRNQLFGTLEGGSNPYVTAYHLYLGRNSANGTWKVKIKSTSDDVPAVEKVKIIIYGH